MLSKSRLTSVIVTLSGSGSISSTIAVEKSELIRISVISLNLLETTVILSCDGLSICNFVSSGKLSCRIDRQVAAQDRIVSKGTSEIINQNQC